MSHATRIAHVEEIERVLLEFGEFAKDIPPDLYDVEVPGEEGSVRAILGHVIDCAYGHVAMVAKHCGGREVERRFPDPESVSDPETLVAALLDAARHAREALEGVSDEALETRFEVSWGQIYDGDQMMEHAICHPPRHIRQLKRFFDGEL